MYKPYMAKNSMKNIIIYVLVVNDWPIVVVIMVNNISNKIEYIMVSVSGL